MAARLDSVARYICDKADWDVTHLQLQKLLYLAQMFHMGRTDGQRLFDGTFEAWDYGPVEPTLYHRAKMFGAEPMRDIFFYARTFRDGDPRRKVMDDICRKFLPYSAGDLVEITHADDGAWATHYVPKARNIRIPDEDIFNEYRRRQRAGN
ncbi:DUF4065 domain-containing protein [Rhizobium sp. RMa-01]|uniref:Panacea domain-containing protein n=1 Tax=Rhizobium sp. RSm-3 TaxID=1720346 RepID=UPI0008D97BF9|nr:hypothetical protein BBJ66_02820 [Rhizobium sp. RSm-3]RVU12227.1 DUF4065 domain-containing protein [Rhizobium sp. RMa-01]